MNAPFPQVRLVPLDGGVIELAFADDARMTLDLATRASDLVRQARADGRQGPVLVDLRNIGGVDLEARQVQPANSKGRVALLIDSFLIQSALNMFFERNVDGVTRRVFRSRELAIGWLLAE